MFLSNSQNENVILVKEADQEIGIAEKMAVHKEGILHRAFSIFVFNSKEELLLQQRAKSKYHSGGLWSNTCCSHPKPGESLTGACNRRLKEEMGLECELTEIFSFIYRAEVGDLIEHEVDHVFFGRTDCQPFPCLTEVGDWKWINLDELRRDVAINPDKYTYWLRISMNKLIPFIFPVK